MPPRPVPSPRAPRALVAGGAIALALLSLGYRPGPPPDRVGACGVGPTCRESGCHQTVFPDPPLLTWSLEQDPPAPLPPYWVPGAALALRLRVDGGGDTLASVWGFEMAPLSGCDPAPAPGGDAIAADPARVRRVVDRGVTYLSHACTCPTDDPACCGYVPDVVPGENGWSLTWIPPARGTGDVRFAVAFNAANHDGTPEMDRIVVDEVILPEEPCPPRIGDLMVRKVACEPSEPGELRARLTWSGTSAPTVLRATTDRALLGLDRTAWGRPASTCLPADGVPVTYYSVAEDCLLGGEGLH